MSNELWITFPHLGISCIISKCERVMVAWVNASPCMFTEGLGFLQEGEGGQGWKKRDHSIELERWNWQSLLDHVPHPAFLGVSTLPSWRQGERMQFKPAVTQNSQAWRWPMDVSVHPSIMRCITMRDLSLQLLSLARGVEMWWWEQERPNLFFPGLFREPPLAGIWTFCCSVIWWGISGRNHILSSQWGPKVGGEFPVHDSEPSSCSQHFPLLWQGHATKA